jgi:hypothetical protein
MNKISANMQVAHPANSVTVDDIERDPASVRARLISGEYLFFVQDGEAIARLLPPNRLVLPSANPNVPNLAA